MVFRPKLSLKLAFPPHDPYWKISLLENPPAAFTVASRHQRDAKPGVIFIIIVFEAAEVNTNTQQQTNEAVSRTKKKNGTVVSKSTLAGSCGPEWQCIELLSLSGGPDLSGITTSRPDWRHNLAPVCWPSASPRGCRGCGDIRKVGRLCTCGPGNSRQVICHSWREEGYCKMSIATCWDGRVQCSQVSMAGCKIHRMFCTRLREKAHMMHSRWLQRDIPHYFPMHSEARQEENRSRW